MEEEINPELLKPRNSIKIPTSGRASFSAIATDESDANHGEDKSTHQRESSSREGCRKRSLVGKVTNLNASSAASPDENEFGNMNNFLPIFEALPESSFEDGSAIHSPLSQSAPFENSCKDKEVGPPISLKSNIPSHHTRNRSSSISRDSTGHRRTSLGARETRTTIRESDDEAQAGRSSLNSYFIPRRSSTTEKRRLSKSLRNDSYIQIDTGFDPVEEAEFTRGKEKMSLNSLRRRQSKQSTVLPVVETQPSPPQDLPKNDPVFIEEKQLNQATNKPKIDFVESPNESSNEEFKSTRTAKKGTLRKATNYHFKKQSSLQDVGKEGLNINMPVSKPGKSRAKSPGTLFKRKLRISSSNLSETKSPLPQMLGLEIEMIHTTSFANSKASRSKENLVTPGFLNKGKLDKSLENLGKRKSPQAQKPEREIESIEVAAKHHPKSHDTTSSKDQPKTITPATEEVVSDSNAVVTEEEKAILKTRRKQSLNHLFMPQTASDIKPTSVASANSKITSTIKTAPATTPEEGTRSIIMAVIKSKKLLAKKLKKVNHSSQDSLGKSSGSGDHSARSSIVGEMVNDMNEEEIISRFIKIFPTLPSYLRKVILKDIIGNCDPGDMKMLNATIPRFHRDFLSLCDSKIANQILQYVSPTDLIVASGVSKTWYKIMKSQELWYSLYNSIGLASMSKVFFLESGSVTYNANLFSSIYNWAHGIFSYRFFQAHCLGVLSMSFDGKTVATASSDMTAKVFNVRTGALLRTYHDHDGPIHAIQHDSERVVTGSSDSIIRVWKNHGKGDLLGSFRYHTKPITCLKLRGDILISGSEDKTVRVWDLKPLSRANRTSVLNSISDFDPEYPPSHELMNTLIPIQKVKKGKAIEIHELTDDERCCQRTLHGHDHSIKALDICGNLIISGDIRGYVILWHISSGNCLNVIGFHNEVEHPIQVGFDVVTDMRRDDHSPILHEPIAEIQYVNNRLLVSTLSGYAFMSDVKPLPEPNPDPLTDYTNFYNWAIDPSTFNQKPTFHLRDSRVTPTARVEHEVQPPSNLLTISHSMNSTLKVHNGTMIHSMTHSLPPDIKTNGMMGKWTLCSKSDEWRLLTGGSQGYISVFNHRIGKFIYKLEPTRSHSSDSSHASSASVGIRKGSFQDMLRTSKTSAGMIRSDFRQGSGSHTITALDFDDAFIVGCGMDGKIHIWEPKPSVVNFSVTVDAAN